MKTILFATSNPRKIQEANNTLAGYDITVEPLKVDIDEIQHQDSAEITKAKARAAYEVIHKPVVVSDTSWEIPALNGFPGGYMKDVSDWFTAEDWLTLMARHDDKTIYCHEHIAYFDGDTVEHFVTSYKGTFIDEPRGRVAAGESIEQVVILYGGLTLAEYVAQGKIASAGETLEHWKQFAEWYSDHLLQ
jgi:XTP/dITP diphosphohydrolase